MVRRAVESKTAYDRLVEETQNRAQPAPVETPAPEASPAITKPDPLQIERVAPVAEPHAIAPVEQPRPPESPIARPEPRSTAERRAAEDPKTADSWTNRRRRMQKRLENGNAVPQSLLEPFRGEPWADDVIRNRKAPRVTPEDSLASRRGELENQLRDLVAREIGPEILRGKPQGLQSPVYRGEKSPGSLVPLDEAIQHAEGLPADHPAKLVLHNLRELQKNPRGTKIQKFNTGMVPDGSRVEVNPGEILTIDREEGLVKDGVTTTIPEGGMDLYGKKLLPPKEAEIGNEPFPLAEANQPSASAKPDPLGIETPTAIESGLFGQPVNHSSGIGEQRPMFHEPNEAAPVGGEKVRASAEAVKPGRCDEWPSTWRRRCCRKPPSPARSVGRSRR